MSDATLRDLERRALTDPTARAALGMAECRAGRHPAWEHVYFRLTEEDMLRATRVQTSDGVREYREWRCPRCGGSAEVYLADDRPRCAWFNAFGYHCDDPPSHDGYCIRHAKLTREQLADLSVPDSDAAWWVYWSHREGCAACSDTNVNERCPEGAVLFDAFTAADIARMKAMDAKAVPHAQA